MKLKVALQHLSTILRHKYYVFKYMKAFGFIWQGLIHDLTKFTPIEFCTSIDYYTGTKSPIGVEESIKGYSSIWLHHKGHNAHHWQYWTDWTDGVLFTVKIPYNYLIELVCDYLAAGKTYNPTGFTIEQEIEWWNKEKQIIYMEKHCQLFVSQMLLCIQEVGIDNLPKLKYYAPYLYNHLVIQEAPIEQLCSLDFISHINEHYSGN